MSSTAWLVVASIAASVVYGMLRVNYTRFRELQEKFDVTKRLYYELLYQVERKHPNETRHETALRYIRQAENQPSHAVSAKSESR